MTTKKYLACAFAILAGAIAFASIAIADVSSESQSANQPKMELPPGWTEEDMQACMIAGTPGKMHDRLASDVGEWHGKVRMWMMPDSEPMETDCTTKVSSMMDGRFTKIEWDGDMPGMGPYHGFGINGYDNVSQKFVSIWLDNHSTGIMRGVGKLSDDGKTLSWKFTFNCPLTKKPAVMRQEETMTGSNEKKLVMYTTDPKSGKEYKLMTVALTKK